MLPPRRIARGKANVPFILAQAFIVTSRIFVGYQANRYAELPGESARKFDRNAAKLSDGSARYENGIRGYQASAKLALWGEPCSCVVLGVSLSIPYGAVKKSGENAQENSGRTRSFACLTRYPGQQN